MNLSETNPEKHETLKPFDVETDRRIHEHLANENDQISEDDIRNIKTTIDENNPMHQDADNPIIRNPDKKHIEDDSDPEVDNSSWEVLDS